MTQRPASFYITQDYHHEIIINDSYELCRPHFKGINDLVFTFLYSNPNKAFTRKGIETADYEGKTQILATIGQNFSLINGKLDITLVKPFLI